MDLNSTRITFVSRSGVHPLDFASTLFVTGSQQPADYQWAIISAHNDDGDTFLEPYEQFTLQANLSMAPEGGLTRGEEFMLTIRPDLGAGLEIRGRPLRPSVP